MLKVGYAEEVFRLVLITLWASAASLAQVPANLPSFEVASIKPSDPTKGLVGAYTYPGGRVFLGHCTLQVLIADAFELQTFQVKGGPGWTRADDYDIDARPPAASESAKPQPRTINQPMNAEQRQMLLALLADRFALRFHREKPEGAALILSKGRDPKLSPPADPKAYSWVGSATDGGLMTGTGIRGINASMALLAERLQWYFERPVIDQTGIPGTFDFKFATAWDGPPITSSKAIRSPEVLANVVAAVQGIGLKLEPGKTSIETIVIDGVEKPTPD
jgi:uncharacterized protein (TIGR03435 family)